MANVFVPNPDEWWLPLLTEYSIDFTNRGVNILPFSLDAGYDTIDEEAFVPSDTAFKTVGIGNTQTSKNSGLEFMCVLKILRFQICRRPHLSTSKQNISRDRFHTGLKIRKVSDCATVSLSQKRHVADNCPTKLNGASKFCERLFFY